MSGLKMGGGGLGVRPVPTATEIETATPRRRRKTGTGIESGAVLMIADREITGPTRQGVDMATEAAPGGGIAAGHDYGIGEMTEEIGVVLALEQTGSTDEMIAETIGETPAAIAVETTALTVRGSGTTGVRGAALAYAQIGEMIVKN